MSSSVRTALLLQCASLAATQLDTLQAWTSWPKVPYIIYRSSKLWLSSRVL